MRRYEDLGNAIPCTPEVCKNAVMQAVATYEEKQTMRSRPLRAILVLVTAAILLCGTMALAASEWNVFRFLQLKEGHLSSNLVERVSTQAVVGDCSIQIDSVVTDGKYLAFDWTVQNSNPAQPVYIQVDSFTGNGIPLNTDGTDDFNCQWFPGMFNEGMMQDGNLTVLPEEITGDTLNVEMVIGVYTPKHPVCSIEMFDEQTIRQKQSEGYYVIVGGEGLIVQETDEGIFVGYGRINDSCADDFEHTEMVVRFTVNLSSSKETLKPLALPAARETDGIKMQYATAAISPLQMNCIVEMYTDGMNWKEACALLSQGWFDLTDKEGSALDVVVLEGWGGVRERDDECWCVFYEYAFVNDASLPDMVSLSFLKDDGQVYLAPIAIR